MTIHRGFTTRGSSIKYKNAFKLIGSYINWLINEVTLTMFIPFGTTQKQYKLITNIKFCSFLFSAFLFIINSGCSTKSHLAQIHLDSGISYVHQGKIEEAITEYSLALEINPKYALAYVNRGQALAIKESYTSAIEDATRAIEIDNSLTAAYINRSFAYAKLSNFGKAVKDLDTAQKLEPKNVTIYINRGGIYSDWGKYREALEAFNQALKLEPNNYDVLLLRATTYVAINEIDKAINDLTTAIEINPTELDNYMLRAVLYYKMLGNLERAREELQRVLELAPDIETKQKAEMLLQEIKNKQR